MTIYIDSTLLLTKIKARPIMIRPIREANHRPIRCPKGPKRLVPIRYEMEAGKKAAPNCHFSASILSIMNIGREGSSMAMPILAKVMAPKNIYIHCIKIGSNHTTNGTHICKKMKKKSLLPIQLTCCYEYVWI